jgi:hypothetical protein
VAMAKMVVRTGGKNGGGHYLNGADTRSTRGGPKTGAGRSALPVWYFSNFSKIA